MGQLKYLVIHCTDTPPDMDVTKGMIEQWHKSPRDVKNDSGRVVNVRYLSKDYPSRQSLPDHYINGVSIRKLHGRGWDRVGYSDMISRDGSMITLTPYDEDDWIDESEKTYGALKFNSQTRHIVLVGGWFSRAARHGIFDFDQIFTDSQFLSLQMYVKEFLAIHPTVKVAGHNQVQNKTCPQFDVPTFLDLIAIPQQNYYE